MLVDKLINIKTGENNISILKLIKTQNKKYSLC